MFVSTNKLWKKVGIVILYFIVILWIQYLWNQISLNIIEATQTFDSEYFLRSKFFFFFFTFIGFPSQVPTIISYFSLVLSYLSFFIFSFFFYLLFLLWIFILRSVSLIEKAERVGVGTIYMYTSFDVSTSWRSKYWKLDWKFSFG